MAKKFLSDIELDAGLVDVNGNTGTSGQILSSTGTGVDWISQDDITAGQVDKALSLTLQVKNTESVALTKGQVVCAAPTATPPSGNVIEVKLADNNGTDSMPVIGILNEGLDAAGGANDEGEAIMFGRISGINTSAFSVGDEVFVSDTPGGLTATKPTGVKYIQKVGVIMRDDASNGTIEVFGAGRTNDVPTPLYVDHANQRLGIRKTSPSSELHINNDSALPQLTLSNAPVGGYGGGGKIIIEGGTGDYVYGSIEFKNGGSRDAIFAYSAASREMSFRVNERGTSGQGYFRFYNQTTEVAEINPSGIYGNVFYDQGNTAYYLNPASSTTALNTPLGSARVKDVFIGNSTGQISNRVWFDNGSSNQPGLYFEGGQPKFIIYSSVSNIFHDTYHPNADTWTTARTITLGGDLTGSVSIDGSGDVTLSAQVTNNSHQHNALYENSTITYGASQLQWMDINGNGGTGLNGSNPQNPTNDWHYHMLMNHANSNGYYVDLAFDFHDDNVWFQRNEAGTLQGWRQMFHDGYHPNADTWTTARTITIGNTGKSVNGSANVSWSLAEIGAASSSHTHTWADISGETANSVNSWGGLRHETNDGYIDFGPANSSHAHIYTDRADFYLNKRIQISGGSQLNTSDVRSAIFYDIDNTAYYLNPASTSNLQELEILRNSSNYTVNLTDAHDRAGLMIKSSTNFDSKLAFSSGANSIQYIQALNNAHTTGRDIGINPFGGNVGIGTTSPGARLHVSSGTANEDCVVIIESDTDNNDETSNPRLELRQDAGGVVGRLGYRNNTNSLELINQYAEALYLGTSNSTDLTILSNGNVGIGTDNPQKKLNVSSSDQSTARIRLSNTNTASGGDNIELVAGVHNVTQDGFSIYNASGGGTQFVIQGGGNVGIGKEAPSEALDVDGSITSNATIWTGYDAGVTNSISCSGWFRSSGSTGWYNATYGGGIYMVDSTWVRAYNNKKFFADNTIESNSGMYAPIFYDRNNTGYFFNGDASKDNVDLVTGSNYAINVLGTISGGHRKHGNLETPEMQFSVGGSTDLNWKKLFDVVTGDASYSGWGAEIEITDFSGNFGSATYSGGELYKGALSIYHWGGTGTTPETPYANIPYALRNNVRWYKIQESGQNRYQLQVKSVGNYQQLYIKVKPGIGNQVADIISYANDTNGATSGGTAYTSTQTANFNHEFAGGIWTNDSRTIGWKNAYGSPYLSSYYGSITTSAPLYVGGPTGNGQDVYCDDLRSNKVFDRAATAYYFEGGNTGDSIRVAGDVVAYYSSDKRLKDNIKPIENALDKVKAISGVTFEWNEKSHKTTGKKDVGVVAQEIEDVLPELVETRTNGYKAVDYQKLTAVLIESVKELTAKVEALENKQCNCK